MRGKQDEAKDCPDRKRLACLLAERSSGEMLMAEQVECLPSADPVETHAIRPAILTVTRAKNEQTSSPRADGHTRSEVVCSGPPPASPWHGRAPTGGHPPEPSSQGAGRPGVGSKRKVSSGAQGPWVPGDKPEQTEGQGQALQRETR